MDRRPRRDRDESEPNKDPLSWWLAGIAAIGVASAAAVAIGAAFSASRDEDEDKESSSYSPSQQPRQNSSFFHSESPDSSVEEDEPTLTITVDATPSRGGGIIRFPNDTTLYFYSVDWTDTFSFPQEADKFEIVNALVALEIVKQFYPKKYQRILLQTDNNFALKQRRLESDKVHTRLIQQVKEMMNSLLVEERESNRKISHVSKDLCRDMKLADYLSRDNMDAFTSNLEPGTETYFLRNLSNKADLVLPNLKHLVPKQFWNRSLE